jgi:hypothetical protein
MPNQSAWPVTNKYGAIFVTWLQGVGLDRRLAAGNDFDLHIRVLFGIV